MAFHISHDSPQPFFTPRQVRGMGLVTVAGSIGAAAVGDEHKVILDQVNGLLLAVLDIYDLSCDLLVTFAFQ